MAYKCLYQIDRGVLCTKWTPEAAEYCSDHQKAIDKSTELEREMLEIIKEARKKKDAK